MDLLYVGNHYANTDQGFAAKVGGQLDRMNE